MSNNYFGAPVRIKCLSCGKIFPSEILIRNGQKEVYRYCPICRKQRINYNNTVIAYAKLGNKEMCE